MSEEYTIRFYFWMKITIIGVNMNGKALTDDQYYISFAVP